LFVKHFVQILWIFTKYVLGITAGKETRSKRQQIHKQKLKMLSLEKKP